VWNVLQHSWQNADEGYCVPGMWERVQDAPLVGDEASGSELSEEEEEESESESEDDNDDNDSEADFDPSPRAGDNWIYADPDNNNNVEDVEQQFVVEWDTERKQ
jgi:hypothetical protein